MTNKNFPINRKKSAFSLIELSIVMTIIAILITGSISTSTTAIKNAKVKTTKERIEIIRDALHTFVYVNKRLPCPASLNNIPTDAAYGNEVGTAGICTGTGVLVSTNATASTAGHDLAYGAVPIKALGLTLEMLVDGFGNKFTYIVPPQITEAYDYTDGSPVGFEGTNMTDSSYVNAITISETASAGSNITTIASYAVISHGPNGFGAYNENCNSSTCQNSPTGGNADEDNNAASGASGDIFNNIFVANSGLSDFDDIVGYGIRENIVGEIGGFNITVCTAERSEYVPACLTSGTGLTFPTSYYSSTANISSNQTCASLTGCSSGTVTRKCGLNGQWEANVGDCSP